MVVIIIPSTDNLSANCSLLTESVLTVVFQVYFTCSAKLRVKGKADVLPPSQKCALTLPINNTYDKKFRINYNNNIPSFTFI